MNEKKDKQVLVELMQFGYDRNVIALTNMKGNAEVESHLDELSRKVINSTWQWFNVMDKDYTDNYKRETVMRFCFTTGIGAAWFWENRREEVEKKGLFESMAAPRTTYAMDEYIEDVVGIWWSSESLEHHKYLLLLENCYDIINRNYDLTDKEQESSAGLLMMTFGMHCGYTRIYRDRTIELYKGEMPWHWEVWQVLYGEDEELEEYQNWAAKAFNEGKQGIGRFIIKKDPESEYGMIDSYFRQGTYHEEAGLKTLTSYDNEQFHILTATPIFDSGRSYHLILDKVYVWENGAEATITAHFSDDKDFEITFYDVNYLENKDLYYEGVGYMFDLYAIAYNAQIVPEEERSFSFEGENAVNFNKKVGNETEYDENGNPKPIEFSLSNLHSFHQLKKELPEDASFQSPIKAVWKNIDFLGKKVHEVEIGLPYHNHDYEHDDKKHPLSVFIAERQDGISAEQLIEGEPLRGTIYLQGKMRFMANMDENPSTILHSFDAKEDNGTPVFFTHECQKEDQGLLMSEKEQQDFAKHVYCQILTKKTDIEKVVSDKEEKGMPDFCLSRRREVWVMADVNYTASSDFITENKDKYLVRAYCRHRNPIIAYISLYDEDGHKCKWIKGGRYSVKIHYGSVLPGQKMEITKQLDHNALVEVLFNSFKDLNTRLLSQYLHKDLDYRSCVLADPIITKEDFLIRTENVMQANKRAKNGPVQPELIYNDQDEAMIILRYSDEPDEIVKVQTESGLITSIEIDIYHHDGRIQQNS